MAVLHFVRLKKRRSFRGARAVNRNAASQNCRANIRYWRDAVAFSDLSAEEPKKDPFC